MSDTTRPQLPAKPRRNQPCNQCGFCCITEPCSLAVEFLGCTQGPCVALEHEDGRAWCGLVRHPARHLLRHDAPAAVTGMLSVHIASVLGLGSGCDADDPD